MIRIWTVASCVRAGMLVSSAVSADQCSLSTPFSSTVPSLGLGSTIHHLGGNKDPSSQVPNGPNVWELLIIRPRWIHPKLISLTQIHLADIPRRVKDWWVTPAGNVWDWCRCFAVACLWLYPADRKQGELSDCVCSLSDYEIKLKIHVALFFFLGNACLGTLTQRKSTDRPQRKR